MPILKYARTDFEYVYIRVASQVAKPFSIKCLNSIQSITRIKQLAKTIIELLSLQSTSSSNPYRRIYCARVAASTILILIFLIFILEKLLFQNGRQISYSAEICPSQRLLQGELHFVLIRRKSRTLFYDALINFNTGSPHQLLP
jgi:hypothetical protein